MTKQSLDIAFFLPTLWNHIEIFIGNQSYDWIPSMVEGTHYLDTLHENSSCNRILKVKELHLILVYLQCI